MAKRKKSQQGAKKKQKLETAKPEKVIQYLLSDDAMSAVSLPKDELLDDGISFPLSEMSHFQCLLACLLLSKPFSHRLGMRAINVLSAKPYQFTTPKAITSAGHDKVREALEAAHTLHKDKTTGQLMELAEVDEDFSKGKSMDELRAFVEGLNGFAEKTTDIFFRLVQFDGPFLDSAASEAAEELGLPSDATALRELVSTDEEFRRVANVLVLVKLDKRIEEVKSSSLAL